MMYKSGIIGCGRIAGGFEDINSVARKPCTHAGMYTEYPKTELTAVSDIIGYKLQAFKKRWNVDNGYLDYRDMIEKEELDIVSICTQPYNHKQICLDVSKTNVKAIICEKPISISLKEADEMISACKKKGIMLIINNFRRWDIYFDYVKTLINEKAIGNLQTIHGVSTSGLMNGGSHLFDLMRFYAGDVYKVNGNLIYDNSLDPDGVGIITFKNGVYGLFESGFREYPIFGCDLIGDNGMIRGYGMIRQNRDFEILHNNKKNKIEFPVKMSNQLSLIDDVVKCIESQLKPKCVGEDGVAALEIISAIHQSSREGKEILISNVDRRMRLMSKETSEDREGVLY